MPDSTPSADAGDPLPTGIPSARVQLRAALDMSLADGSPCVSVPLYLDEVRALLTALTDNDKLRERVRVLEEQLNTPEVEDFARGVVFEAQHQRSRWGNDHNIGKENTDWFWLVGYLAGKALAAANAGNGEKALHHTISTAAALANWHAALIGANNEMQPGHAPSVALATPPNDRALKKEGKQP